MAREHGLLFDRVAEEYDRARPGYPDELVDEACAIAGLSAGSHVVEVGCGTGKLTVALAARELRVEAVDPGPALLQIARRRVAGSSVRFHSGRFEDVELPPSAFDAVFSATAFHWVDPAIGWAKVARVLEPGGTLALLAYVGGWPVELQEEFLDAWREVLPEAATWAARDPQSVWSGTEERRGNVSELWAWLEKKPEIATADAAQLFDDVRISRIDLETTEAPEDALALVRTQSAYLRLDAAGREQLESSLSALIEREGGGYRSRASATLVTARVAD